MPTQHRTWEIYIALLQCLAGGLDGGGSSELVATFTQELGQVLLGTCVLNQTLFLTEESKR